MAIVAGGAHLLHAGADIIEAGQHCGEIGSDGVVVDADQHKAENNDAHISGQIGIGVRDHFFADDLPVVSDKLHTAVFKDLRDIAGKTFDQIHETGDL